ncbi:MAG: hypothetical protein K0Q72_3923, partial [Armatimonadetes bacterium]|nr:hypothetical protein [Armatimonadota bacterium]
LGTLLTDDRGFVDESLGLALNGGGAFTAPQVVGAATGPDGIERAFRWGLDNETIEDLGLGPNARALGINDAETICGRLPSGGRMQAFTYSGGIFHTFTLPDADDQASSVANAINSGGTIAGTSQMRIRDPSNNNQIASGTFGFKGAPGGNLVRLPSLQPDFTSPLEDVGRSIAWGLNDAGVVVGESTTASGPSHAVVWPGTGLPTDLGTLAPGNVGRSVAYAINSVGRIVGAASTTADQDDVRACFWQNATPQLLTPNPPNHRNLTEARAINSAGLVVGWGSFAPAVPIQRALLWRQNAGQWEEIRLDNLVCPDEGWQLQVATGINNNGMITGYGTLKGEFTPRRAFLLELPASILLPPRSGRSRPGSLRRSR